MKVFRLQVRVATQMSPVFMPCDQGDLLNLESNFKQPTCPLVSQIVEMEIRYAERATRLGEVLAHG